MLTLMTRLKTLFAPRSPRRIGDSLYAQCVAQSRLPVFYLDYAVPDEIGARFELLTFHVGLVIQALRAVETSDPRCEQARDTAQDLFDVFLLALDSTLREQGTGDLSVPKKMKKLGQVIYTRMQRWEVLLSAEADGQVDYAARTLYAGRCLEDMDEAAQESAVPVSSETIQAFTFYARAAHAALRVDDILQGRLTWPLPAAMTAA